MSEAKLHTFGGHIWAFNTLGWFGIFLFTGLGEAAALSLLCLLAALSSWWKARQ